VKLLFAVNYESEQRTEFFIEDADGKKRRIEVAWKSRDPQPIMESWRDVVKAEVEEQRTIEWERKTGRGLL